MSPDCAVLLHGQLRAPSYLKDQLLGRQGHEDSITPCRASCVHILLSLAGVLAVRVAVETKEQSINHTLVPEILRVMRGRVFAIQERMHTVRFLEYEAKLETQVSSSNLVLPGYTYRLHGSGWLVPIYPLLTQRPHTHGLSLVKRPPASCACHPGDLPIHHSCKTWAHLLDCAAE